MLVPILTLIARELSATRPLRDFANLRAEDHLFDDLEIDSLDRVSLAIGLEAELGIDIPDQVSDAWFYIADVVASIERLMK